MSEARNVRSAPSMTFAKNQRLIHGVSTPIVRVRPEARDEADGDGE